MPSSFPMITFSLVSLLISSFTVHAAPVSDSLLKRDLSCNGNASDGITYTTASNSYEIHCGTDYYGGDLSTAKTANFQDCLSACDSATGCLAVAYVSGQCYLKKQLLNNSGYANARVWGAKRITASVDAVICPQNNGMVYQSGGRSYTIHCSRDYFGGDLSLVTASTLELCIAKCDATSGCIDVSHTGNQCYLKNKLSVLSGNQNVDTAVLTSAEQQAGGTNSSSAPTCEDSTVFGLQYTASNGLVFTIECSGDYKGGDLTSLTTATFVSCIEACVANTQCIDVSYLGTTCYLKSSIGLRVSSSSAWTARLYSGRT